MTRSPKRVTSGSEYKFNDEVLRDKPEFTDDGFEERYDLEDDASRSGLEFYDDIPEQEFEDIDGFTYDILGDQHKSCEEDYVYEDDFDEWEKDLFDSGIAMGDEMKELFCELKEVGKFDSYQEVKSRLVKLAIDDDEVVHEVDKLVDKLTKLLLEIVSLQSRLSDEIVAHKVEEEDTCSDDENESE